MAALPFGKAPPIEGTSELRGSAAEIDGHNRTSSLHSIVPSVYSMRNAALREGAAVSIAMMSLPVLLLLIAAEYVASIYLKINAYRLNDAMANMANAILKRFSNITFDALFLTVYAVLYDHFSVIRFSQTSPVAWVALFVLLDLQYYWHHRFSHRVNFAWAAHSVHHQSEDFNLTVALRMSATQTLIHWSFNLIFAFVGFGPVMLLTVYSISTVAMYWYHTRLIKRLGVLEHILMTPSHHRVHHGRDAKYLDKNYGGILITWDKMFGTFEPEVEEPNYGVRKAVRSWQPLKCQFAGFVDLVHRTRALARWRDKVLVWFVPPEHPLSLGETSATPAMTVEQRYDAAAGTALSIYALFQFVIAAAIAIAVFVVEKHMPASDLFLVGLYVLFSMTCVTLLMERGRLSVGLELLRLAATPLALLLLPEKVIGGAVMIGILPALQLLALVAVTTATRHQPGERTTPLAANEVVAR
jgi:alkylglycerol monooxygenase